MSKPLKNVTKMKSREYKNIRLHDLTVYDLIGLLNTLSNEIDMSKSKMEDRYKSIKETTETYFNSNELFEGQNLTTRTVKELYKILMFFNDLKSRKIKDDIMGEILISAAESNII